MTLSRKAIKEVNKFIAHRTADKKRELNDTNKD